MTSHTAAGANYDESKVPKFRLPDPLETKDGNRVKTADAWRDQRAAILNLFEKHVYGIMPPKPDGLAVDVIEADKQALGGRATRHELTIHLTKEKRGPAATLVLFVPNKGNAPYPVFLGYNFEGNHTVHPDPGIRMSTVFARKTGAQGKIPDEKTRGTKASRWAVEKIISRGYALGTIYYGDVDPDFYDDFKNGIHPYYPEYQNRGDNWTSIGAWAWALSRTVDYFEKADMIDAAKVVVIGHSRLGKTSLWAGATDERFAIVVSNNSGCGGAALARRRYGETVKRINTSFPHWFCKNHHKYNDNEDALPVDQHMLIALMAPRPVYVASAVKDRWADPRGEFLSCLNADPVYKLLGKEGLPATEWPPVDQPVAGTIGYHVRSGGHDVTDYDWDRYLDFADKHL
jgi:hypothetical protein